MDHRVGVVTLLLETCALPSAVLVCIFTSRQS